MANNKTYNICGNWGLKCFSQHIVNGNNGVATGVILSCTLNGKKRQDGSYPKGIQVSVFCPLDGTCNIQECDYSNTLIDVSGTIGVREYINKNTNQYVSTLSIYASSVSIHEWKNGHGNNGGGNNYRNNGNYRQTNNNNGYSNNGYNGGNNGNYRQGNNRNNGYNNNYNNGGGYNNNYGNNGYNNNYNGGYNG